MTKLSVNINKVATLRNARGGNNPNVVRVALDAERFGAQGITVHPRPDERHIRRNDVFALKEAITTELNIEGYPDQRYMEMVAQVKPAQATLVPDPPEALTSNTGWDTVKQQDFLRQVIQKLKKSAGRVSVFVNPDIRMVEAAATAGADRIELYTEPYARKFTEDKNFAIEPYLRAAAHAQALGLGINAGHDLDLHNLQFLVEKIPFLEEVSIGHALICDALYYGLENTIQMYLQKITVT